MIHRLLFITLAFAAPATGATIVVAKNGPIDTIQAGIDAAAAGDTVKVKKGVYQENVVIGAAKTGLRLVAAGAVVIDARPAGGAAAGPGIQVDASDVRIIGIEVRNATNASGPPNGSGFHVTGNGFVAQNCVARGCIPAGFEASSTSGARFTRCAAVGGQFGFLLTNADSARLTNCSIRSSDDEGVAVADCSGVVIRGCRFTGTGGPGFRTVGGSSSDLTLAKCRFELIEEAAIDIGDRGTIAGVTITGCRVRVTDEGLAVSGASHVRIDGNRFDRIQFNDVAVDVDDSSDIRVEKNVVRVAGHGGFSFQDDTGLAVRNNEARDVCVTNDEGFFSECTGARFENNRISGSVGPGFEIRGDDCDFLDNQVSNCLDDGFLVKDSADGTLLDGNLVRGCTEEGLDHRGTNSVIRNNVFTKCRLDLTNDGTAQFQNNKFKTGGETTPHEID